MNDINTIIKILKREQVCGPGRDNPETIWDDSYEEHLGKPSERGDHGGFPRFKRVVDPVTQCERWVLREGEKE